jgi:hypothetical protein
MTGLVRKATLLSGAMLMIAGVAMAGVPSAANSPVTGGIQLGGTAGGVVDAKVQAVITVRDASNNPVPNSTVELLFANCYSAANTDIKFCNTQPFAGLTTNCAGKVIAAITNASGQATFRVLGGATALPGNSPGITGACLTVRADGVVINNGNPVRVGAYDLNSASGVNAADNSLFQSTLFQSPAGYRTRCDYNGDGACNSADLAKLLSVQFGAGSTASCASFCL